VATDLPPGPDFFRFSDESECNEVLPRSGFAEGSVSFETVRASWRIPHAAHLFYAQLDGGVRVGALLRAQTPERQGRIRDAMLEETRRYETTDGSCVLPIAAHAISARAREPSAPVDSVRSACICAHCACAASSRSRTRSS